MAVVAPISRARVPSLRDLVLVLVVGFLLLQQALPRISAFAQDAAEPQANTPLGAGFTYQGKLNLSGGPATGQFDFVFALFDQASGGLPSGTPSTITKEDIVVTGGLFATELDFGASAFTGSERYLEVRVRPGASTGQYETLTPRQELTPAPYALYSSAAGTAATATTASAAPWTGITGIPAGFADGIDADALAALGSCQLNQVVKWNGGSFACASDEIGASGTGDITAVIAGTGLTGGAPSGDATLGVTFGGDGAANSAARSDHNHFAETWSGSSANGLSITNSGGKGVVAAGTGGGIEGTTATDGSAGVSGTTTATCLIGTCYGVRGTAQTLGGYGVRGDGFTAGVHGESFNTGVSGLSPLGTGVQGQSTSGTGVQGQSSSGSGVVGQSATGSGVYGSTSSNTGTVAGVQGASSVAFGTGVIGTGHLGVRGEGGPYGVLGLGTLIGVEGRATSSHGNGVNAEGEGAGFGGAGVYGLNQHNQGCPGLGAGQPETYCFGIYGNALGPSGIGVYGKGVNTGVWGVGNQVGVYGQGGTWAGYFAGTVIATGTSFAAAFVQNSDANLKRDVTGIQYGLDEVLALRPVSYGSKAGEDDRTHLGLVAQEVEAIIPEAVYAPDDKSENYRMSYSDLTPVLIRAIQQQQAQIEALRGEGGPGGQSDAVSLASSSTRGSASFVQMLAAAVIAAGLTAATMLFATRRRR
ncbi:hypothetical protein AYO38_02480 [bacterium SCGC AG-212-C10]|nr:hypothetical protein AYO38_02480 [bacterium SCGC AG-212-C10]